MSDSRDLKENETQDTAEVKEENTQPQATEFDQSEAQWYMSTNYDTKMPAYKKAIIIMSVIAIILFVVAGILMKGIG